MSENDAFWLKFFTFKRTKFFEMPYQRHKQAIQAIDHSQSCCRLFFGPRMSNLDGNTLIFIFWNPKIPYFLHVFRVLVCIILTLDRFIARHKRAMVSIRFATQPKELRYYERKVKGIFQTQIRMDSNLTLSHYEPMCMNCGFVVTRFIESNPLKPDESGHYEPM